MTTIRFLDPPLHEFLPHSEEDIRALAKEMDLSYEHLKATKIVQNYMNLIL